MVSRLSILTNLLLVSAALGVQSSHRHARLARRRGNRQSQPSNRVESLNLDSTLTYSSNWAGAVWSDPPDIFTTVTALVTVPFPSGNAGSGASAWVGIDGDTCQSAILQTGVDLTISNDGEPLYSAWYEWFPEFAADFSGITISAGDNLNLTVTAFNANSGLATIENLSNGNTVSQYLTSGHALCRQDAEWIVEDYDENGSPIPFTDFHSITFSDAYGFDASGTLYDPAGATLFNIEQNGQVLTDSYAIGSSLIVEYTG